MHGWKRMLKRERKRVEQIWTHKKGWEEKLNFGHRICVPIRKGKKWLILVAMIKIMKGRKGTEAIMRRAATALIRPIYQKEREETLQNQTKYSFVSLFTTTNLFFLLFSIILDFSVIILSFYQK